MDDMDIQHGAPGHGTTLRLTRRPSSRELSPAAQAWLKENQAALDAFDRWHEENGSPLDDYRQF